MKCISFLGHSRFNHLQSQISVPVYLF